MAKAAGDGVGHGPHPRPGEKGRRSPRSSRRQARRNRRGIEVPLVQDERFVSEPDLARALKVLRCCPIADTLADRLVLADKQQMSFEDGSLLLVTDAINRRPGSAAARHRSTWHLDRSGPRAMGKLAGIRIRGYTVKFTGENRA